MTKGLGKNEYTGIPFRSVGGALPILGTSTRTNGHIFMDRCIRGETMDMNRFERVFGILALFCLLFAFSGCGLKTRSVPRYVNGEYAGQETETYVDGNEFTKDLFSTLIGVTVGVVTFNAMGGDCSTDWFSSEWFVSGLAGEAAAGASSALVEEAERREQAAGKRKDAD